MAWDEQSVGSNARAEGSERRWEEAGPVRGTGSSSLGTSGPQTEVCNGKLLERFMQRSGRSLLLRNVTVDVVLRAEGDGAWGEEGPEGVT